MNPSTTAISSRRHGLFGSRSLGLIALHVALLLYVISLPSSVEAAGPCDPPINPIVCENSKPGSPESEWDISGDGDESIQGFATDISVNKGETVSFKVDTPSTNYRLDIYRLGYYGGMGARKIATIQPSASLPQIQPACLFDATVNLVECGNWAVSASWQVPANAISGIYFAHLVREDPEDGRESHIVFIVRDDSSNSDILFQTSDTTWQTYNAYGGYGSYTAPRAYKVSYNRPFATRGQDSAGLGISNFLFYAEYPMVRWLEANGYDVTYFTGIDADRGGGLIQNHEVFLSVGHDEYWSKDQRENVEAARDAGVNLAFFSGNEVFWKTRWENSTEGSNTPYRTLVVYKETFDNAKIDPSPEWTGTWRDPRFSPPADGGRPENELTGQIFTVNRGTADIEVPYEYSRLRLWRNTSIASLSPGEVATLGYQTLGYEWDEDLDNGFSPAGLVRLSSTYVEVPQRIVDYGTNYLPGEATHHLTLYRASSGALVFGAGTVQWSWGLDVNHDEGPDVGPDNPDVRMQQATVNLFADMDVQPGTLQSGLVAATKSTDQTPPTSIVTSPANGTVLPQGQIAIAGTAADSGGGRVGGVEVSVDGGTTWHPADGTTSWTYTWLAGTPGVLNIRSRAVDDSGNLGPPSPEFTLTVTPRSCPCSIWPSSSTPFIESAGDFSPIELGVRFQADVDGYVTGIRFYKGETNDGNHLGHLWTENGVLLATATFSNESATGWQQANFPAPVPINANVAYVVSYYAENGGYSIDNGYFISSFDNYPLQAQANVVGAVNGVFKYGASSFPTDTYNSANYWVDLVFDTSANDTIPPAVIETAPAQGAIQVDPSAPVTATFSEPVDEASIFFELRRQDGSLIPSTLSYDAPGRKAILTPNALLAESTTYVASLSGAVDLQGNQMAPVDWSFTTSGPATSLWLPNATPLYPSADDPYPVELGLKFKADVDGYVSGVRFYKGVFNTGAHIGNLWSETGERLATAIFKSESASGWQQVDFPVPVAVTADTIYVISYHTDAGNYSFTPGGLGLAVDSYPLHAPASIEVAGGNGVFRYGPSAFPTATFSAANYWVDVVFSQVFLDTVSPEVVSQTPAPDATDVSPTSVKVTFSEPVVPASISFTVQTSGGANVPGSVSYDAGTLTATFTPDSLLALGNSYLTTVSGAADPTGNTMGGSVSWSFSTVECPCTLFPASAVPSVVSSGDPSSLELGFKFQSEIDGYITGIRFYKSSANTGTHVGHLWSETGTLLTSATFTNETGSGWQQVYFAAPVPITAGTTYVASYHTDTGFYSVDLGYFGTEAFRWPLRASTNGNGVFKYGASGFPTGSYNASNYWVDVVFTEISNDSVSPMVTSQTPAPDATGVAPTAVVTATFSEPVDPTSISFGLETSGGANVSGSVSYDAGTLTATFTPSSQLDLGESYIATLSGAQDPDGNVMAPESWSFSTVECPCTIFSASAVPAVVNSGDPSPLELGVKFESDVDGYITGIRFYKSTANTGTHLGHLWTETGTLLAAATFTNESGSGWQQVDFATPVQITAGTTYVASYHTDTGFYSVDLGYFGTEAFRWPLRASTNGNGVFKYGASGFPTGSYNASNYWVDVVFSETSNDSVSPMVTSQTPAPDATDVAPTTVVTATFSELVDPTSISFDLETGGGANVSGSVSYDAGTLTATFTPDALLDIGESYTATVSGAEDPEGNVMAPESWSFSTLECPCTIWPSSATPTTANSGDPSAVELGVKFQSAVDGYITGIRFYKGSANTGTHVGNLWDESGTLLATAEFTNETASGWQEVTFETPVAINAGAVYVASYHTDTGNYSLDLGYFGAEAASWPVSAPATGDVGGNGVFHYGASGFSSDSYGASNYWVDIVFSQTP